MIIYTLLYVLRMHGSITYYKYSMYMKPCIKKLIGAAHGLWVELQASVKHV